MTTEEMIPLSSPLTFLRAQRLIYSKENAPDSLRNKSALEAIILLLVKFDQLVGTEARLHIRGAFKD